MIEVRGLTKHYGDFTAISGLSFTVAAGEVVGLVGPNGAGKTTTLRSLVGIVRPSAGTIRIAGHDLATEPLAAKRALAFLPDEPHLFDHLTVAEHLTFVGRLYQVADAPIRARALLRDLELDAKRDAVPSELSRGMKQKLAIACALLHRPRALLLDEPLTGLDPGAMRRMKRTILAQTEEGAAVLLSSHILQLVEELCTRILVIHRGGLVADGTIAEIVAHRPELVGRGLEDVFLALTEAADEAAGRGRADRERWPASWGARWAAGGPTGGRAAAAEGGSGRAAGVRATGGPEGAGVAPASVAAGGAGDAGGPGEPGEPLAHPAATSSLPAGRARRVRRRRARLRALRRRTRVRRPRSRRRRR